MNIVDRAAECAFMAHFGQVNHYSLEPYILHPHRVYCMVRDEGHSMKHQAAAWLHDSIEDSKYTIVDLQAMIGDKIIVAAVDVLTKKKGETLEEYYARVKLNEIAKVVKIYDMTDNFRRNHLISDEATRVRMAKKYSLGFDLLRD